MKIRPFIFFKAITDERLMGPIVKQNIHIGSVQAVRQIVQAELMIERYGHIARTHRAHQSDDVVDACFADDSDVQRSSQRASLCVEKLADLARI